MRNIFKRVVFKDDKAYFLLNKGDKNPKKDIVELIRRYNLRITQEEINEAIKSKKKQLLLSEDISIFDEDEKVEIIISKDKLMAELKFTKPMYKGALLSKEKITELVSSFGISYGIKEDELDEFLTYRYYDKNYIIAIGKKPEDNIDGRLEFLVDISAKKRVPKVLEDGYLDYKSLDLFQSIKEGDTLVKKIASIKGEDGIDVTGAQIANKEPEEAPPFPEGENTETTKDGMQLISSIDGYLFYGNKKVNVVPILRIPGDVDNTTGNIDFIGTVEIVGNVLTGFSVVAKGDINVKGCVEGAYIKAGGDIIIEKGVQGGGKAVLIAGKDIRTTFMENATIDADNSITADSLMHCNTNCGNTLKIVGRKGLIVGNKTIVGGDIYATDIGSTMSNNTEIHVGITPKALREYERLVQEIEICYSDYNNQEKIVEKLSSMDIKDLSDEKKLLLVNSIKRKIELKKNITAYKKKILDVMRMFTKRIAKIEVSNILHSQTKIIVNNAIIFIKEEVSNCVVKNDNGVIKIIRR